MIRWYRVHLLPDPAGWDPGEAHPRGNSRQVGAILSELVVAPIFRANALIEG